MAIFTGRRKLKFAMASLMAFGLILSPASQAKKKKAQPKSGLEELKLQAGDENANDARALKTEMLIATSEKKAIRQAKKLINKYRGTSLEPDLHFRLAELYMRRSKTDRFLEVHRKSETVVKMAPALVKRASSKRFVRKAIKTYDMIERRFPRFNKMDIALFNNGFARQQLGQTKAAAKKYWKVIKNHSYSPLVADCHLAVGEIYFEKHQFKTALDHFNAIKKYPQSRVYPYGLYKAGWSFYNLSQAKKGMKELEKVVDYGKYVVENKIDARLDLRKEALADMTIFYEDVYPAKDAFEFFQKQSGELDVSPVILRLANLYKRHGRFRDKEVVLLEFIDRMPTHDSIPEVHEELVWNADKMKDRKKSIAMMEQMYEVCQAKSKWVRAQKGKTSHKVCKGRLEKATASLAKKWLGIWKKNRSFPVFAEAAEKAFEIYLRPDLKAKGANEARFLYAELLFQQKKFRLASDQYGLVGKVAKNKTQAHDARYAALLSLEKAVGDKWNSEDEKRFSNLAKTYLTNHPKGKFRLDIEFKTGLIAYEKSRYDEAGVVFQRIGTQYAKTEKGRKAQDLYLDILNLKKDYEGLKNYSKTLMSSSKNKKRLSQLNKIYEESYFTQIQTVENGKDYSKAIAEYKKFARSNPKSALAQKAWWNAVQLHFKTMDQLGGAEAAVDYYNRFPKNDESMDALLKAAQIYESMGELNKAAGVLLILAEVDKKKSARLKWKTLAADFFAVEKRLKKAEGLYTELLRSPSRTSFHALEKLTQIAKQRKNIRAHKRWLKQIVATGRQPQASLAQLELVEYIHAAKDYEQSFVKAKKVLNMKNGASKSAKAKARFMQAEILEAEFRRQNMKSQASRVHLVLGLKTEKLDKAQRAYQAAMRYGDAEITVKSLEKLADIYAEYVQSLRSMPLPSGLGPNDESVFRAEMDKLAIPMEEKSVQTLAEALTQAKRFGLHDDSADRISAKLDRANMRGPVRSILDFEKPAVLVPGFVEVGT